MKTQHTTTVSSTFTNSDAVEMTFDPAGSAHLMNLLSNVYRDKATAVLREYASNALDSHLRSGNTAPIEVTLPTLWDPTLQVRDHGTGLSEDELLSIYATYGTSTKRDSNTEVGAFGIGAKAGFTMAGQFTVTATKDGQKCVALFELNQAGVGTVDIKIRAATSEANGVTVAVSVPDPEAMRQAASRLFAVWEPGTVQVDGEAPKRLTDTMLPVTDTLFARRPRGERPDSYVGLTVVMGGIPYPVTEGLLRLAAQHPMADTGAQRVFQELMRRHARLDLLAFVPVGDVDITPSREDLRDTPRTVEIVARLLRDYGAQEKAAAERALASEPTPLHAVLRLSALADFFAQLYQGVHWRGQWISPALSLPFPAISLDRGPRTPRTSFETVPEIRLGQDLSTTLVITEVDEAATKTVRRLANRYMTHHQLTRLLLAPDAKGAVAWLHYGVDSPLPSIAFTDFKERAAKLPKVTAHREPEYRVLSHGQLQSWPVPQMRAAVDNGRRLLLCPPDILSVHEREFVADAISPNEILVILDGNQTPEALRRRFKDVGSATSAIVTHAHRVMNAVTDQELLALDYVEDRRLERAANIAELRTLPPIRQLLDTYMQRRAATRALPVQRLYYLQFARRVAKQATSPRALSSGFPLLDLVLDLLGQAPYLLREVSPELRGHLELYLAATEPVDNNQQHGLTQASL